MFLNSLKIKIFTCLYNVLKTNFLLKTIDLMIYIIIFLKKNIIFKIILYFIL